MTSPYFQYGAKQRYVFQWNAGQGGVLPAQAAQARAPISSTLGAADMLEGGYGDPNFDINYPALRKVAPVPQAYCPRPCALRATAMSQLGALGATAEYTPILATIATNIVGAVKSILPRSSPPGPVRTYGRRNGYNGRSLGDWPLPRPQGFEPGSMATGAIPIWDGLSSNQKLVAFAAIGAGALWWLSKRRKNPWSVTSRSRGVTGSLIFRTKKGAREYANYLKRGKKPARIRRVK